MSFRFSMVWKPPGPWARSDTLYVPGFSYVWTGSGSRENVPSPKVQRKSQHPAVVIFVK